MNHVNNYAAIDYHIIMLQKKLFVVRHNNYENYLMQKLCLFVMLLYDCLRLCL